MTTRGAPPSVPSNASFLSVSSVSKELYRGGREREKEREGEKERRGRREGRGRVKEREGKERRRGRERGRGEERVGREGEWKECG